MSPKMARGEMAEIRYGIGCNLHVSRAYGTFHWNFHENYKILNIKAIFQYLNQPFSLMVFVDDVLSGFHWNQLVFFFHISGINYGVIGLGTAPSSFYRSLFHIRQTMAQFFHCCPSLLQVMTVYVDLDRRVGSLDKRLGGLSLTLSRSDWRISSFRKS